MIKVIILLITSKIYIINYNLLYKPFMRQKKKNIHETNVFSFGTRDKCLSLINT